MAERKFNDPEMRSKIAQSVASTHHATSGGHVVTVPLSTIQHGGDDHSSYHRSVSPSRPQGQGGMVQRPAQQQQPRWIIQGLQSQPRMSAPIPKPAPRQQMIRGPVVRQGGEKIVLQRPPNQEGTGLLRQQLFQKISQYPESHENVFMQYKQGPVSSTASSVQELIEQHGRQSAVSKDIPAAHSGDRYSPTPQQVHIICLI